MGFKYSSFISWAHADEELSRTFITSLHKALSESIEPLVAQEVVYLDQRRLIPGYRFNPALARAMCESASWVLVFTPRYLKHEYCCRELAAMQALESHRRSQLGKHLPSEYGLIIPVVFRGEERQIPSEIRDSMHYLDFRKFNLIEPDISRNSLYVDQIGTVASYIAELCEFGPKLQHDCGNFELPAANGGRGTTSLEFPGRHVAG